MVERHRHISHPAHDNLIVANDRPRRDSVHTENADFGEVDDRCDDQARELSGTRHREGRAAQLIRCERAGACTLGEAVHLVAELLDRQRVRRPHDRNEEAFVSLYRDADVVAVEVDDLVAFDPCVQLRELSQRQHGRAENGGKQQRHVDVREVALFDVGDRRYFSVCARKVLDDLPAHAADALAPALGSRAVRPCERRSR